MLGLREIDQILRGEVTSAANLREREITFQMGWILRPFIGQPDLPVTFFREDAWGNAYVIIVEMVWSVLSR